MSDTSAAPGPGPSSTVHLLDDVWERVLSALKRRDTRSLRRVCRLWRQDIARCLARLELSNPSPEALQLLGALFTGVTSLKLNISESSVDGLLPRLAAFARLVNLTLAATSRPGRPKLPLAPAQLPAGWRKLRRLQLHNCLLASPQLLAGLAQLQELHLLGCECGGSSSSSGSGSPSSGAGSAGGAGGIPLAALAGMAQLKSLTADCLDVTPIPGCPCPWSPLASLSHLHLHLHLHRLPSRAALLGLDQLRLLQSLRLQVAGCAGSEAFRAADVLAAVQGLQGLLLLLVRGHAAVGDRELLLAAKLTHLADLDLGLAAKPVEAEAAAAGLQDDGSNEAAAAAYEAGTGLPPVAISSRGLAALTGLRGLRRLGLSRCRMEPGTPARLACLSHLEHLDLGGVQGVGDTLLFALGGLRGLTSLVLAGCRGVSDIGMAVVARCFPALQQLDISGCQPLVTDLGLAQLAALAQLRGLLVAGCDRITDAGVAQLVAAGLPLKHLDLRACVRLTDACLLALASRCGCLRRLHLDNCTQLTTAGIVELASLPALHTLSLLETGYDSRAAAGALAHVSSVLYARLPGWWMAAGPEVPAAAQVAVAAGGP